LSHLVETPEHAAGGRLATLLAAAPDRIASPTTLAALVGCMDLTSLGGTETAEDARALCERAARPGPAQLVPSVAAVCVYPELVAACKRALEGSRVAVASVAGAFPSGRAPLASKLEEVRAALSAGADEIDTVIDHSAFLAGERERVFDEIAAIRQAAGDKVLKVILETGQLGAPPHVRAASELAIRAGADFLKTSTGKTEPGATLGATLIMLDAIADHHAATGKRVGIKPAGGIRTARQACEYLLLAGSLGESWLGPSLFRLGASALLDDVLKALAALR
jgi:deoxyribose-phosphate aldolase